MRRILLSLLVTPLALLLLVGAGDRAGTKRYKGPWFDVRYPASFTVVKTDEEDGISFRSRDGAVVFYVYSPQWNGQSAWAVRRGNETLVDSSLEMKGEVATIRVTCRNLGGLRSWEDIENRQLNVRRVFGVAYRNEKTMKKYRAQYLAFKRSLVQYAD